VQDITEDKHYLHTAEKKKKKHWRVTPVELTENGFRLSCLHLIGEICLVNLNYYYIYY